MKLFLSSLSILMILLGSSASQAEKFLKRRPAQTDEKAMHGAPEEGRPELSFSGGLVTISGDYAGSFLTGVTFPASQHSSLRLGIESGLLFASGTAIPIFVSVYLPMRSRKNLSPYFGLSMGPTIGVSGTPTNLNQVTEVGMFDGLTSSMKLAFLFRPGVTFEINQNLRFKAEMPFGGLTGLFYIGPMVGLTLKL